MGSEIRKMIKKEADCTMFRPNSKSQTTLEFLTNYMGVLIVVLIMITTLWYFGFLRPSKILPKDCQFSNNFECTGYEITYDTTGLDGQVKFQLMNKVGYDIIVDSVGVSADTAEPYGCEINDDGSVWPDRGFRDFTSTATCNSQNAQFSKGKKGKVLIALTYHKVGASEFKHDSKGKIYSTVRTKPAPTQPECNDGIDNDENGCTDYAGGDTGCGSASDTTESGGTCPAGSALDCSVVTSCSDTIVFRMSGLEDAHAEIRTSPNYNYGICCSSATDTLSNSCASPDAVVLHLSDNTDAHVEKSTQSNFNIDVCLSAASGTISCRYTTSDCLASETCLATISADTDAHVADCVTQPFNEKICCEIS